MKKILLLLLFIPIFIGCTVTPNPEDFFINEEFVLYKKYEKDKVINGQTRTIRTWEIVRLNLEEDSLYFGIIDNSRDYTSSCGSNSSIITDELWKSKDKGSILHFDYINKNRFHKRPKVDYTAVVTSDNIVYSDSASINADGPIKYTDEGSLDSKSPEIINMNNLEIERRILEIEREIMSLELEKEKLIESQK